MFMILYTTGIYFRKVLLCLQISESEREVKAGIKEGIREWVRERGAGRKGSTGADQ